MLKQIMQARTITIIAVIWLVSGLVLLVTYWLWDWQVLAGIATWVLAGGVFFAFWQIRLARKSTNAQIAMGMYRELRNDRTLKAIRFIYELKPEDVQNLPLQDRYRIEHVLDRLDMLAVLVDEDFIAERLAIDVYSGVSALRCWFILHQYVWQVREKRKYYGENVEAFTNHCMNYFEEKKIKVGLEIKHFTKGDLGQTLKCAKSKKDKIKKRLYPRSSKEIKEDRKNRAKEEAKKAKAAKKKAKPKLESSPSKEV